MPYQLYAFGSNGEGQLGISAQDILRTPTLVPSWKGNDIQSIAAGDNHTVLIDPSWNGWAAGDNRHGQLGRQYTGTPRLEEFKLAFKQRWLCAATCTTTASIYNTISPNDTNETHIFTDGSNLWGELGRDSPWEGGGNLYQQIPDVEFDSPVWDIAAGGWHYVLLLRDGEIWGWGKARLDQLGPMLTPKIKVTSPTRIVEPISFKPIKAVCGKEFTYLAGVPSTGQHYLLGRDKNSLRSSMPPHIKGWKDIGATWNAIFILFEDGTLTAWGKDNMWKLMPEGLPPVERMAVGSEHVLAVTREGKLISWGWGKHGNCGDLGPLGEKVVNDMVSGFWNQIDLPGEIRFIGAGFCTSFVLVDVPEENKKREEKQIE